MGRPSDFANSVKFYKKIRERRGITNVIQEFKSRSRHDYRHWVYLKGSELACSCECFSAAGRCWHSMDVLQNLEEARRMKNRRLGSERCDGRRAG